MTTQRVCGGFVIGAVVAICCAGCGTSGSNPVELPEVRFEVKPSGPTTFRVESLTVGNVDHSVAGKEFAALSTFTIVLENAAPPYQAIFTRTGSAEITATLSVASATGQVQVSDFTSSSKSTVVVGCLAAPDTESGIRCSGGPPITPTSGPSPASTPPLPLGNPEVRFDVCAGETSTCFTAPSSTAPGDSGAFGATFTGTAGDAIDSHLLTGATPTIYFLEGARQSVNGVFARTPYTGDILLVQLFLNGALAQSQADTKDVLLRHDL